ncbi:hypothetical protein ATER59S_04414 [Aquamicrobium terrae]
MPWKVDWRVDVDGRDVSANMRPYLIDIEITDKDGTASDTCSLTFDDTNGQTLMPKDGAKLRVYLQGALKFAGTVDSVRSNGTRGGGRTLKINAKGFDSRGKVKQAQGFHKDDASLEDFFGQAARQAGLAGVIMGGQIGSIMRDYWAADGESFLQLGQRLAREFNATFKIRAGEGGDMAVLMPRDQTPLAAVQGIVGRNVISWDIEPFSGRRKFTKGKVKYFDREVADFKTEEVEFDPDDDQPEATNAIRATAADQAQARGIGEARKSEAKREGGGGTVEMDLTVEAQAEAPFVLSGARPGIDGSYRIVSVQHKADRGGGSTTKLEIKQPGGGAGKDKRKAGSTTGTDGAAATQQPGSADTPSIPPPGGIGSQ